MAHTESIFTELSQYIERKGFEVKEQIFAQQKLEMSQAEGILMDLEQEIAVLRRTEAEWLELSHEEDNVLFIKVFSSIYAKYLHHITTVCSLDCVICFLCLCYYV